MAKKKKAVRPLSAPEAEIIGTLAFCQQIGITEGRFRELVDSKKFRDFLKLKSTFDSVRRPAESMSFSDIHDADFRVCGDNEASMMEAIDEYDSRSEESTISTEGLKLFTLHTVNGKVVRRAFTPRLCGDRLREVGAKFPVPEEDILDKEVFCQQLGLTEPQFQELISDEVGFYLGFDTARQSGAEMEKLYELPIIPSTDFEARLAKQISGFKLERNQLWGLYFAGALEKAAKTVTIVTRENDCCVRKAFNANSESWEMPPYAMALDIIERLRARNPGHEYRVTWWDVSNKAVRAVLAVDPDTCTQSVPVCGDAGDATFCPGIEVMVSQTAFCAPTIRDGIVVDGRDALLPSTGVTVRDSVEMDDLIDEYDEKKSGARAMDASTIAGMTQRLKGDPKDTLLAIMGKAGVTPTGRFVKKSQRPEPGLPARAHQPLWKAILGVGVQTMTDLYVWIIRVYLAQTPGLSTSNQEKIRTWLGTMVSWNAVVRTGRRRI